MTYMPPPPPHPAHAFPKAQQDWRKLMFAGGKNALWGKPSVRCYKSGFRRHHFALVFMLTDGWEPN